MVDGPIKRPIGLSIGYAIFTHFGEVLFHGGKGFVGISDAFAIKSLVFWEVIIRCVVKELMFEDIKDDDELILSPTDGKLYMKFVYYYNNSLTSSAFTYHVD